MANIYKNANFDLTTTSDVTDLCIQAPSNSRAIIQNILLQTFVMTVNTEDKLFYMITQLTACFNNVQSYLTVNSVASCEEFCI